MWGFIGRVVDAIIAALSAFYLGTLGQKNRELEDELRRVEKANRAAAGVDGNLERLREKWK